MNAKPRRARRAWWLAIALGALLACAPAPDAHDLRLVEVGPFGATVTWQSDRPFAYRLEYGEGSLRDRVATEDAATTTHRLAMTGLRPATRYGYRLAPGGAAGSFRTAPAADGAFDVVVLAPDADLCRRGAKVALDPDVVVLAGACAGELAQRPADILTLTLPATGATAREYGSVRLVTAADLDAGLAAAGDRGRRVIVVPELPAALAPNGDLVVVSPRAALAAARRVDWEPRDAGWLEVDAFEIARVRGQGDRPERRTVLAAPPETRKSCLYCDRLLESGRYEESLAWYRDFIAANSERHAVEDAYFAIAQIYDDKLFDFPLAIAAYETFLAAYPDSRRAPLARNRLEYLAARADDDFRPLAAFARAKAEFVRGRPEATVAKIEGVLREFPGAAVAPEATYWCANALDLHAPARAAEFYRLILARFPHDELVGPAAIALGDIAYRDKRYRDAIAAYDAARVVAPAKFAAAIDDKLRRSHRNVGREIARWSAWALLAGWLVLSLIRRARPRRNDAFAGGVALAAYVVVGGAWVLLHYTRTSAMLTPLATMATSMAAVMVWNRALARHVGAALAVAHVVTASAAAMYLALYQFHLLFVFGL